jgi:glycyl-tRNA synthetase
MPHNHTLELQTKVRNPMSQSNDFQTLIMKLENFWAEKGCLIWQPYHTEVGAGTMNPATALRVLGPEPWNVGYVEPSIRPDDGRYGQNPNRFYQHIQYQVILKPDPGNPQELYLQSLEAMGINRKEHDIRFVEDNWESPVLGAWGLGWEVWLDGLEITQYTYFQQSGGQTLDPVSVELTYGMERIVMALQRVRDFRDIQWNDTWTYGDVYLQNEQEASKYAFELADVDRLRQMFDLYEIEAKACLEHNQVLPAHDYVLKCSHTFNVIDTRGAVGVTERQGFFRRMRVLSRRVAEAYIEQRQRLEFPWLDDQDVIKGSAREIAVRKPEFKTSDPQTPATFLLEIGVEELPHGDLETALSQLNANFPKLLEDLRLEHGEIEVYGTPRRLVIHVNELAPQQDDLEELVKGPPADRAFDAEGNPTRAAEGFARSKGIEVDQLQIREMDGGKYAVASVRQAGRPTAEVLKDALPDLIAGLRFDKSMRWNHTNVAFSRPIRWLLALHGGVIIPFEYAGLQASNKSHGLRFIQPEEIMVETPADYFSALAAQGILLKQDERKASIEKQIEALAAEVGGTIFPDPDLLTEVTHLVEAPTALLGDFDPHHLELPREVLISVMKKHQRYFPIARDGKLLPHFITVANKPSGGSYELIIRGNEDVIRARFADAAYFVREDLKVPLEDYLPQLDRLTFQIDLGSMLDKTKRIEQLVGTLSEMIGLSPEETTIAHRAAHLCKADLATQMVVDMTSLQGAMGHGYALASGEPQAVAEAIFEHYLPRSAEDNPPKTLPGLVVGLADRLDSLTGLFAAGLAPTGAKDPFAQRRAALGLVGNLIAHDQELDLRPAIEAAASNLPIEAAPENQADCLNFIVERLRNILLDQGFRYDIVDAVVTAQGYNPARAIKAVAELASWVKRDDWHEILPAYSRCVRITRDLTARFPLEPGRVIEPAERELLNALNTAEATQRSPGSVDDFLNAFLPMIPTINQFFDDVLVMVDDQAVRENRLGLLQRIAALADEVADMSRLEGF